MRLIIQRVKQAKVFEVASNKLVGAINEGFLILCGIHKDDTKEDIHQLSLKVSKLRILEDETGKMNKSILDTKGSILVISQFTLLADTKGGNRPSFIESAQKVKAEELYELFISELKKHGIQTQKGSFGYEMEISAMLSGPVTIYLDSYDL